MTVEEKKQVDERIKKYDELSSRYLHSIDNHALKEWLIDNGFFTAPASTKFHGAYIGGLFDHSLNVTRALINLTDNNHLTWDRFDERESQFIIGMFHDLCKIDCYKPTENDRSAHCDNKWIFDENTGLAGHGDKSIMLLSQFTILTEEEIYCIRYHMGAFTDSSQWKYYTNAIHKYPNVLWTHTADMIAVHIEEK